MFAFRVSAPVFVFFLGRFDATPSAPPGPTHPHTNFLHSGPGCRPLSGILVCVFIFGRLGAEVAKVRKNRPMDRCDGKMERGTWGSAIVVRFLFVLNCHFYHQKLGPTQCLMRS